MDFRTTVEKQVFGVRVSALIIKDEQIYLAKSPKDKYYLVGGAILVNEETEEAIKREVKEELGVNVLVNQLAFIVENHFHLEDKDYHQIEFLYRVTPLSQLSTTIIEDSQERTCHWVPLDDLDPIDLNPACLKSQLKNWDGQLKHIIHTEERKEN